ncbi:PDZ domain-containing protein [Sphingomonas sp. CGMCC 1.13654]|uniref:PDZ domain-containing protein n=1 Tax=Sphingomonas chungangi TaxID=2683589 RepID=A0A838L7U5_9SPHN|nr:PDZ domain-containing protein [Sphingomonas chungangi]
MVAPEKTGMAAYRHAMGLRGGNRLAIGIAAVVATLLLILMMAERGTFRRVDGSAIATSTLPGVTLDNDGGDQMPVVTSVRSNGEAERAGIRAGDEIEAVDGRRVRDIAALRSAVVSDADGKLDLHIRRGDALWSVALDRDEPAAGNVMAMGTMNGPENTAD